MLLLIKKNNNNNNNNKNGRLGYGGIVRDFQRKVKAAFCLPVNISVEPIVGEALAVFQMVKFCRNRGFTRIILKGDSLLVLQAINYTCENWSKYGNIIVNI
jgi:ribonuclease HI